MKKIFTAALLVASFAADAQDSIKIPARPKVGLSLSGGGAKGFAHIGALQVLDSIGVKIDYLGGTSMGAIIGGLYASGYSGKDIENIVLNTDIYGALSDSKDRLEMPFFSKRVDKYLLQFPIKNGKVQLPTSLSSGQRNIFLLKELLSRVSDKKDFSKLPTPFFAVATNIETGKAKILEHGDLAKAIMASSAFPSLLEPVKIDDSLYVDGGIAINFPSKPLRDKGMNFIVGVNLGQGLSDRKQLNNIVSILDQIITFGIVNETGRQIEFTDINMTPDLKGYGVTSFDNKKELIRAGYDEALKYSSVLEQLPKDPFPRQFRYNPMYTAVYKIDEFEVENNDIYNRDYIAGKMGLKLPALLSYADVNKMIDKLYATDNYRIINYEIQQGNGHNKLRLFVNEDDARFYLKFGLHYDDVFKTGLLGNITVRRLLFNNSTSSLDVVVGDRPRYYFNYLIDNGYIPGFGLFSTGMSYALRDSKGAYTDTRQWYRNEAFIQSTWRDRYAVGAGLSYDIFNSNVHSREKHLNPYVFLRTDTRNRQEFSSRGFSLDLVGKLLDTFDKVEDDKSAQINADLRINFPISDRLTYKVSGFAGISFGDTPYFYRYRLGGVFEQNLGNMVRFPGFYFGQQEGQNALAMGNSLQLRLKKNYFVTGNFSIANLFDDFENNDFIKFKYTSAGAEVGYNSPFGQLRLGYNYGFKNNSGIFSVVLGHWF
ncbi:MAG: patatin [Chryseobacterium sp.]|nr:MAG: patatin [Chryseobacterium sp.]